MSEIEQSEIALALGKSYDDSIGESVEVSTPEVKTEAVEKAEPAYKDEPEISLYGKETVKTEAKVEATVDQGLKPPSSWTVEAKARFNQLDPIIQNEVLKRETDFHKGQEQYKTGFNEYQNFEKAIQPYMPTIQALGVKPIEAVQYLLAADHQLRYGAPQAKLQYFQNLANQYGIDLSMVTSERPQVDPQVYALEQKIAQMEAQFRQGMNQQTQQVNAEAQTEIQKFQSDPKNIYFEDVREDMALLIREGRAKDLNDAYDKACRSNDQIFPLILQQKQAESEKVRIEEAKRKAADAKRAGFDVKGQGSVESGSSDLTLRQSLERAFG